MSARRARKPPAPPDELAPALEAALLRHLEDAEAFGDRAEHARAAREYEAAIKLVPWQPLAYINLAVACGETGDEAYIARSVAAMRAGVAGGMADVHPLQLNLAVALSELERDAEAAPHYLAAWRLSPTTPAALARGLSTHLDQCAWRGHERLTAVLASEAEHVGILELSRLGRAALARRAAERRSAAHARDAADANANADGRQPAGPAWRRRASRAPLRVGYLTADLHAEHPIGKVAAPLLREHSRHFGVRLFSTAADRTLSRAIAVADGRGAIAVEEVAAGEATDAYAARLRDARLHILIDLNSHTRGGRLDVTARRPAPVSMSFLGYTGTSGARFVDYLPADRTLVPPSLARHYTERLVHLPHLEHASQHGVAYRLPSAPPPAGLNRRAVLASWNSEKKLGPRDWAVWMNLARAAPRAVVQQAVAYPDAPGPANLRAQARAAGVDTRRRLRLVGRVDQASYFQRIAAADLAVDVPYWNGVSSTLDILWAGSPLVALSGELMLSRMSAALLAALAVPHSVVHSLKAYEDAALALVA